MKLLLVGDLHVDPYHSLSHDVQFEGRALPSRVVDVLKVLDRAKKLAKEHDAQLIQMGDVFDDKYTLDVQVATVVAERLQGYTAVLRGNHDTYDQHSTASAVPLVLHAGIGHSCVRTLSPHVVGYFLPYSDNPSVELRKLTKEHPLDPNDTNLLFAHLTPKGAKVSGYELTPDKPMRGTKLFSKCFTGHIHVPQEASGWHVVGAALPQNFGESFKPTFTLVEIEGHGNVKVKRLPTKAPRFHTYEINNVGDVKRADNSINSNMYIRLKVLDKVLTENRKRINNILSHSLGGTIVVESSNAPEIELVDKPLENLSQLIDDYVGEMPEHVKKMGHKVIEGLSHSRNVGARITLIAAEITNFLSIKKLDFRFDKGKVTQLRGRNGAGKSALVQAVYWGLTGETLRGKTKSNRVIRNGQKECEVKLTLQVGDHTHVLARSRTSSKPKVTLTGVNLSGSYQNRSQSVLALLGINPVLLVHTTFLTSKTQPFSQLTEQAQRNLLVDSLIGAKVLTAAKNRTKKVLRSSERALTVAEERLEGIETNIKGLKALKKTGEDDYDKRLADYQQQLSAYEKARKKAKKRKVGIRKKQSQRDKNAKDILKTLQAIGDANNKVGHWERKLKAVKGTKSQKCPSCGEKIVGVKVIKPELWKENLRICRGNLTILKRRLSKQNVRKAEINLSIKRLEDELDEFTSYPKPTKPKKGVVSDIKKKLAAEKARQKVAEVAIRKATKKVAAARFWLAAFGDGGVRRQILDSSIAYINKYLSSSMSELGDLQAKLRLDPKGKLEIELKSPAGGKTYHECSDGQQARFDLAMMTVMNTLTRAYSISTLETIFLDERFPLTDEQGQKALVRQLKRSQHRYVVVTREKAVSSIVDRIVNVELQNKVSVYRE